MPENGLTQRIEQSRSCLPNFPELENNPSIPHPKLDRLEVLNFIETGQSLNLADEVQAAIRGSKYAVLHGIFAQQVAAIYWIKRKGGLFYILTEVAQNKLIGKRSDYYFVPFETDEDYYFSLKRRIKMLRQATQEYRESLDLLNQLKTNYQSMASLIEENEQLSRLQNYYYDEFEAIAHGADPTTTLETLMLRIQTEFSQTEDNLAIAVQNLEEIEHEYGSRELEPSPDEDKGSEYLDY